MANKLISEMGLQIDWEYIRCSGYKYCKGVGFCKPCVDGLRLALSEGIFSELQKWNSTLSQIQAVIVDAGQKHLREIAVQLWLNKLQYLAYEIDDVLDDLTTEAMQRQLKEESYACTSASKLSKIIPAWCTNFAPRNIVYGRKMSSKLDEITTKLRHLVEEKNILGLNSNVERSNRASRRLEETSLVDVSGIVGREGDKDALLRNLLGNDSCSENVSILSIVGLGGIGKTTLAQVLYKEKKVKDHFELMAWVSVSDEFDVFNISKAILQAVGGEDKMFANLNLLQVALTEKLLKKRFLLVLDDVWNEDYKEWELLQRPFLAGAFGSKIIVTTRKTTVASMMDSVQAYPLKLLSNEEALSLFSQHALGKQNFDSHPTLKLHGEGIMKKCGGLPLALIAVGRVLRTKQNDEEWEELLNSEIWNFQSESKILPALRLSYYDLPPHLKQMFAYCSLFPKDYVFQNDELVLLWMAEGFLYESKGSKSMENLGRECFEELKSRSFFQPSSNDKSRCTMHDLINDLAMSIAREFFFTLDDKMNVYDKIGALEKFHHLSFIRQEYGVYRKFKALERASRLRSFLAVSVTLDAWQSFSLSNKVLFELLPQLRFLRVLSLTNYSITEVPQSIGSLKHMRYLNFSKTNITCLPEQVGDLYNLQSLLVSGCVSLSSLPESCWKLINLRHLDINDTPRLTKMPFGIGGLTSLQTLSKVIIAGANGFKISDLKGLSHLQGQLSIKGLQKVPNAIQAKEANLLQKKGLCDLETEWSDVLDDSRNEINDYEVLEVLRPHDKLKSLKILYYMGMEFPSWVGDASFGCLTQLTLRGCKSCTCLPTLGHLRSLQKLFIESMSGLKRLGSELLGHADSFCHGIAFPSLELLEFKDMQGWEIWSTNDGGKDGTGGSFPCLRKICIRNCPKLAVVAIESIPSLQVLYIRGCSVAVLRSMVGVSPSILRLTMVNVEGLTQLHGILEHLRAVEYLCVRECDELRYLWESTSDACKILVNLYDLKLVSCQQLVSLGEKEVDLGISLKSVNVVLYDCPGLVSYNCPNSIEKLVIHDCDSATSLTFPARHDLPSTMKILDIMSSHNLEN
ncbi:putative disease resistance RPP13-like protein 1 [Cynara cardunculus var. scolymus]|uniref:putative disease resistance RPP13-like protein 1 n=1 Tax=Cynara cardunculus var. scolymus TaxID=59895 RepID=UPI000D627835|nr:putative disease resistance RPP13-like protein 1 [Cynara cardunculus var. scolymus]